MRDQNGYSVLAFDKICGDALIATDILSVDIDSNLIEAARDEAKAGTSREECPQPFGTSDRFMITVPCCSGSEVCNHFPSSKSGACSLVSRHLPGAEGKEAAQIHTGIGMNN